MSCLSISHEVEEEQQRHEVTVAPVAPVEGRKTPPALDDTRKAVQSKLIRRTEWTRTRVVPAQHPMQEEN
jgi:hypothetical protein